MKKLFYFIIFSILGIFSLFGTAGLYAQSVTIDPSAAGGSNIIQANAQNKALKLPSVAGTSNIGTPQAGQLIYNQSTASPNYYNGTSWQNLNAAPVPSNIFPNSKHFGNLYNTPYEGAGPTTDDYFWNVPAGVTRIWVELWSGGAAGSVFSNPVGNPNSYRGGISGGYLSVILTVVPNEILTVKVCKGSSFQFGYESAILNRALVTYNDFQVLNDVGLVKYQKGNYGDFCKFYYQTYYTGTTPNTITFYQGGNGGNSPFGGRGGEGVLIQSGLNNTNIATSNNVFASGGDFPGGGGGAVVAGSYSVGGNGLILIHW
jgi:hypothetical protein